MEYRSGTVNSKSFVGKVLLQIKQNFKLTKACNSNFDQNFLIYFVSIKGHVEMVDTKDQSNGIVYCVCYVVC